VVLNLGTGLLAQQYEARLSQAPASTPMPCTPDPGRHETIDEELCLSAQISGFGGYDFSGPCEVVAFLTNLGEEGVARALLESHIKAKSPECGGQVSLDIRKGEYEFVDLSRWGDEATQLLLRDEETRVPGADDVIGPFIVDNRVTFFMDPESLTNSEETINKVKQVLVTHGFSLEAFQLTSNPFLTRSLSWNLLGVRDPCVPLNPALAVCFDVQGVRASLVDATPTEVLGMARLSSRSDLVYVFTISWDISVSLEKYANSAIQELPSGFTLLNSSADNVDDYPAIRYDLEPSWTEGSSLEPIIQMVLFIDTGAGFASIAAMPNKSGISQEEIYSGAKRVARILRAPRQ
jgi:hypothetical protein